MTRRNLDRRSFLNITAGTSGAMAGCFTETADGETVLVVGEDSSSSEEVTTLTASEVQTFIEADSATELTEPTSLPAVAITHDEGMKYYADSTSEWKDPVVKANDINISHLLPSVFTIFEDDTSGDIQARDREGTIQHTGSDFATVLQAAIDDLPTYVDHGGVIQIQPRTSGEHYFISSTVTVPGTGEFDDAYFPVVIKGQGTGTSLKMADSANLDPMIEWEVPESDVPAHYHALEDIRLEGNRATNASGTGVKATSPSGHSGNLREPRIRNAFILRFQDTCANLHSNIDSAVITESSIEFTNTGTVLFLDGRGSDLQIKDAGDGSQSNIAGIKLKGVNSKLSNVSISGCDAQGISLGDDKQSVEGIDVTNCAQNDTDGQIIVQGNDCRISGTIDGTSNGAPAFYFTKSGSVFDGTIKNVSRSRSNSDGGGANIINGRVTNPETEDLGGTDGPISPEAYPAETVPVLVDAGGSLSEVESVDGDLAEDQQRVRLVHTGRENVDLVHNDTEESNPLFNQSGGTLTLSKNGDMAEYVYSSQTGKWMMTGKVTQ